MEKLPVSPSSEMPAIALRPDCESEAFRPLGDVILAVVVYWEWLQPLLSTTDTEE